MPSFSPACLSPPTGGQALGDATARLELHMPSTLSLIFSNDRTPVCGALIKADRPRFPKSQRRNPYSRARVPPLPVLHATAFIRGGRAIATEHFHLAVGAKQRQLVSSGPGRCREHPSFAKTCRDWQHPESLLRPRRPRRPGSAAACRVSQSLSHEPREVSDAAGLGAETKPSSVELLNVET
ncbi:hypothetical protein GQ53DRAFT_90225 [Thozetella sp. PMI_491]|nr:hypothetical protein GQ53DRAFT_90225 [Thozetella sp. PMI_491]